MLKKYKIQKIVDTFPCPYCKNMEAVKKESVKLSIPLYNKTKKIKEYWIQNYYCSNENCEYYVFGIYTFAKNYGLKRI